MITFRSQGQEGSLEGQRFSVPGDSDMESILNSLARIHPAATGGHPDPDYCLFLSVAAHWPTLELVSRDELPPRKEGLIY